MERGHIELVNVLINAWTRFTCEKATEIMRVCMESAAKKTPYPVFRNPLASDGFDYPDLLMECIEHAPRKDMEKRLLSLLSFIPPTTPLVHAVSGDFVDAAVSSEYRKVYCKLNVLAARDIMATVAGCLKMPFPVSRSKHAAWAARVDTARNVINSMFDLGVMDTYTTCSVSVTFLQNIVQSVLDRKAREDDIHSCINVFYNLFGSSVLHAKSRFALNLQAGLSKFPKAIAFMKKCDADKRGNLLAYKHVDMSGAAGSKWLRALVLGDERDAEEMQLGYTLQQALVSRLAHFSRLNKVSTKRNIVKAVVDGCTLFEFAIAQRDTQSMGHILLDALVYVVTEEHPDLLDDASYRRGFECLRQQGFYNNYMCGIRSLSRRVRTIIGKARSSPLETTMESLQSVVCAGFPGPSITLYLCKETCELRNADVSVWRVLLKRCLKDFPVDVNATYSAVFKNEKL